MKIAPLIRAINIHNKDLKQRRRFINRILVHTGQHYDYDMSKIFFDDLGIPEPDYYLEAGPGTHAGQTAKIMIKFEEVCINEKPDLIMVVGDVNSTLACSITAKKLNVKVAHIEAGLRSGDMTMPEEINRIVTDSISDYLFVTEKKGLENLRTEGKDETQIFFVGHVMIDNLIHKMESLDDSSFDTTSLKHKHSQYLFLTLHRPSNVEDYEVFKKILDGLNEIAEEIPIFFPIHLRTRESLRRFGLKPSKNIILLKPLSFSESLYLWKGAKAVLTDSGGLQEETTALGVPCLTLRENTERPVTVETGTNTLVGSDMDKVKDNVSDIIQKRYKKGQIPEKWDGKASKRIVKILDYLLRHKKGGS